jgi:hypothetical protein
MPVFVDYRQPVLNPALLPKISAMLIQCIYTASSGAPPSGFRNKKEASRSSETGLRGNDDKNFSGYFSLKFEN